MAIQNQPGLIPAPFANSGTKNVIPETMPTPSASAAASWTDGFPTVCSLPLASGGIPPARADFNGLFNSITQAQAFYQSGGVYEWDATVDYGTNRMVLGSDGLLYWSVAQSGPNTTAGAVDPTTDSGAHWGTMPMKTPGLGDNGNGLATTGWVKALCTAYIYINPAGSDANDGMSSANAVKTFNRALAIAKTLPQAWVELHVAGGNYVEDFEINRLLCVFVMQGNITITGKISVTDMSQVFFSNPNSYSLSISNSDDIAINISRASGIIFPVAPVSVSASNSTNVISIDSGSSLHATQLNITANSITQSAINIFMNSYLRVPTINIDGTQCTIGLQADVCSLCVIDTLLSISNIAVHAIRASGSSLITCFGTTNIHGSGFVVYATNSGNIILSGSTTITVTSSSGRAFVCTSISYIQVTGTVDVSAPSGGQTVFFVASTSSFGFYGTALKVSDAWSGEVACCASNSFITFPSSLAITNNATGKRYSVYSGGQISVNGGGANFLPGSTSGTAEATQFAYYG